jgi:hypothetical protein
VFEGKNGEQWVLDGIFYIMAIQSSILNMPSLIFTSKPSLSTQA